MLHLAHQASLQADEIARHGVIEDLPASVGQELVTERPARQNGVEMRAVAAFHQNCRPLVDREFSALESAYERQLLLFKCAKGRQWPQWARFARILATRTRMCD
ncbi:hypothetical protein MPLSOD_20192 [Mesorhizobium sp. SOD10]|nr:hypothetical protein MPLSOD_20192 [Mesorhizobium sp. SOD10]